MGHSFTINAQTATMIFIGANESDFIPPLDTGLKLSVHKTFRRHAGRLLNVLCTFNLRPASRGFGLHSAS